MFKFGFGDNFSTEGESDHSNKKILDWFPVCEVKPAQESASETQNHNFIEKQVFPNISFKLISPDAVLEKLKSENCNYITEAESQHSDLLPAKYEGGLKIWECTYDLGNYILQQEYDFKNRLVLDLGCGAGLIGLLGLRNGAKVHFQDYNIEIIKHTTIPNVRINNHLDVLEECRFYSGDWESFANSLNEQSHSEVEKYDYIFTSETIYNPDNYNKLLKVFKYQLKKDGIGLIAAKTHYFGVGGSMRDFEALAKKDGDFKAEIVWSSTTGLTREILKITWQEFQQ